MTAWGGRLLVVDRNARAPIWHTVKLGDWLYHETNPKNDAFTTCRSRSMKEAGVKWRIEALGPLAVVDLFMDGENICWTCLGW